MKKLMAVSLLAGMMAVGSMSAFAAEADAKKAVAVTALATMEQPYHQVTALFVEYPEEVCNPKKTDFRVMDFQVFNYTEVYERRPYQEGVIKAVYCNDVPEVRADKTSLAAKHGKYVVIELEPVQGSYYDEEAGMWRPDNIAGIATVRVDGQSTDHYRTDWSLFVVNQLNNLYNQDGELVAVRELLPTIEADGVSTPEMEMFTQECIPSANGKYNIYFNIRLPKDYDENGSYPVVFCQPGAGGLIKYVDQDENGNFIDIGGNSTRDGLPVNVARYDENLIVVTVQPWNGAPAEWEVDNPGDYIYLVQYIRDNYAVDQSRVYGMGNSMGTMITSQALTRKPDLLTAYAECNGVYSIPDGPQNMFSIFTPEVTKTYVGKTEEELLAIAANPDNRLPAEEVEANAWALQGLIENEIPIYFFDGTNTEVLSPFYTISGYMYLKEAYEAKGYTEEQIDNLVRLDLADNQEFLDYGVCEYHESTKIVMNGNYDVLPWLLDKVAE